MEDVIREKWARAVTQAVVGVVMMCGVVTAHWIGWYVFIIAVPGVILFATASQNDITAYNLAKAEDKRLEAERIRLQKEAVEVVVETKPVEVV